MDDLRARFGNLVKAHRRRAGLTQEALAERANFSTWLPRLKAGKAARASGSSPSLRKRCRSILRSYSHLICLAGSCSDQRSPK